MQQETLPEAERPHAWPVLFLENMLPFNTVVDLIQWKKLDSQNLYGANLTEARIEIISFSTVLLA